MVFGRFGRFLGILGDVNLDEVLNIYDAVMLVAIMLAHEEGTDLQLNACDTNEDGIIDDPLIESSLIQLNAVMPIFQSESGNAIDTFFDN